jgi:hypothetical protein
LENLSQLFQRDVIIGVAVTAVEQVIGCHSLLVHMLSEHFQGAVLKWFINLVFSRKMAVLIEFERLQRVLILFQSYVALHILIEQE